jgi:hypothetical protein
MKHIYSEKLELGAYYTYDDKKIKVYDIKSIKKEFKKLLNKLSNNSKNSF